MNSNLVSKVDKVEKFLFWFLCGFAISLPLSKAATNIFLALALVAFFVRVFYKRDDFSKILREYKNIFAVIIFLLAAVLISALTSDFVLQGVKRFLERYVLHMIMIFPTLLVIRDKEKILKLVKLLICGALLSHLTVIIQAVPRLSEAEWRFGGVLSGMIQGSLLAMFLPVYILLFLHFKERRLKNFFCLASILGTITLLLTGTRGAWIAAVILIPLVILIYAEKKLKNLGAILVAISILGGVILFTPTLSNRVATITDLKMQSNSERLLMWQSAWQMFKDNPVFGVGYGSYKVAYQTKYISPLAKDKTLEHAHNNFFQMLGECGIVGFSAFILMLVYFSYFCLRGWAKEKNIAYLMYFSVLWGMALHGLTEFNFETSMTSKIFWFALALCLAYNNSQKIERND